MSDVRRWPRHLRYNCPPGLDRCVEGRCMFCSGGLFSCVWCRGAEGSLTTDCPGQPLALGVDDEVCAGRMDYRIAEGGWVHLLPGGQIRRLTAREGDANG